MCLARSDDSVLTGNKEVIDGIRVAIEPLHELDHSVVVAFECGDGIRAVVLPHRPGNDNVRNLPHLKIERHVIT
jgi:hypothetical protein